MRGRFARTLVMVSLLGLVAGCEEENKKESVSVSDAGAEDASLAPNAGRLGAALASAVAVGGPPPTPKAGDGPPENGVFAPGAGEAALPKAMNYKTEMLTDGSEPRVLLTSKPDGKEQKTSVLLSVRTGGPQGLPTIDFGMSFKIEKAKGDKPKKDAAGAEAAPAPAPVGSAVIAKVTSAVPASMSPGGLPKELIEEFGKLKGSEIRYQLSPTNAFSGLTIQMAKGVDAGLAPILDALAETVALLTPPLPEKPVGVGATWMVADRFVWTGAKIPVLRYRVFKVEKIEANGTVSFSVDSRQYAEEGTVKLTMGPGQEVSTPLDAFESAGKGTIVWDAAGLVPREGEIRQKLVAQVVPPGAPPGNQQRAVLQSELVGRFQAPTAAAAP
ncbi:Hypothetical protein CAP_7866 [Chondromyces apiculatus DSM 436]|uniref:Lipoprotein n=2 Tax=Chondromyces apiculatus TaxID=51 RepID=A0A017SZD9_9BACT|nr:Hypothetical protein CAP_7866 [Chondromyces apiculatus DSM 436]